MDEQSHLARVVEMMKNGKWDPGYYQKPAVHFYLRIPVTAGAFLFEVSRGNLKRLDQLETQDRFNLGGYASASNPPVMILVNRYLSLVFVSLGIFLLALIIQNNGGFFMAIVFALFCSFSFPFVEYCCRLSVDPIAAFFVCATVFFSYRFIISGEKLFLFLGVILAGLAFSTKYNFIVSMLIPMIAVLAQRKKVAIDNIVIACISICVFFGVFIVTNIFAFINYGDFVRHLATQIAHYRTPDSDLNYLGRFYLNFKWLFIDTTGPLTLPLIALGLVSRESRKVVLTVGSVLAIYLLGMSIFKQMFYRNFFPWFFIVNFLTFLSASKVIRANASIIILALNYCVTLPTTLKTFAKYFDCFESRTVIDEWLFSQNHRKTAISAQLAVRNRTKKLLHVQEFDEFNFDEMELARSGSHYLILNKPPAQNLTLYYPVVSINGQELTKTVKYKGIMRANELLVSPSIHIFGLNIDKLIKSTVYDKSVAVPTVRLENCTKEACKITSMITMLVGKEKTQISVENIWPQSNQISFFCDNQAGRFNLLVQKTKIVAIPCDNPYLYTRDLFNPTKIFIPEDINLGVKVRVIHDPSH